MALLTLSTTSEFNTGFPNPNNDLRLRHWRKTILLEPSKFKFSFRIMGISDNRKLTPCQTSGHSSGVHLTSTETPRLHSALVQLAASAIFFVSFTARACTSASGKIPGGPSAAPLTVLEQTFGGSVIGDEHSGKPDSESHAIGKSEIMENIEDKELRAALESFKSKTYALTVPLRIVSLRGSVPPSWVKEFMQAQGKRLKLIFEFRGSIMDIFSDLSAAITKGTLKPKSALAADVVTVGDSWLSFAIKKDIIEPIQDVEIQDWFNELSEKWKIFLCRNRKGSLDSEGKIWAAPYRWGSMVIAYKKNKFKKHNLASIEDWGDLWRPELSGKISMVDSPREVVGAVLKYMGASYNTTDFDSQVLGGRNAVMQNLALFQKQVRLFDSVNYLKAFGVGDVWVAVGWSSDVLPAAKRMSNVAVVVPKSGASLWADLWAIPSATKFNTSKIGGRIRGPSPLINQWIEFCLQPARALPFKQEVIPGASPLSLEEDIPVKQSAEFTKGKPKLETNLIAGVPPPEILAKCEFLEPLSETALKDYQWLIAGMHKPGHGLFNKIKHRILFFVQPR